MNHGVTVTALTASCMLAATSASAGNFAPPEKISGGSSSVNGVPNEIDAIPDTGLDPTVLHSRVALSNEFEDDELGAFKNTTTLNLAYAFGKTAVRDWTVQLDLPVVYYDAGSIRGVESVAGFGDVEFRIGHVLKTEGLIRYAAGVEAEFNTAGGPPLGDGIFRLSPIVAFAVQPCRTFKFQTFVQFNQSFMTETGVSEMQELHVKPAVSIALPNNWYVYNEFEETWGFHPHGVFSSTAKLEIGRSFGVHNEWVLSARCERPLTTSSEEYSVTVGCTYVFQ